MTGFRFFREDGEKEFYSLNKGYMYIQPGVKNAIQGHILFVSSPIVETKEVEMLGLLDVLGTIGGLYELLHTSVAVILSRFVNFQMKKEILNKKYELKHNNLFTYPPFKKNQKKKKKGNRGRIGQCEESNNHERNNSIVNRSAVYLNEEVKI